MNTLVALISMGDLAFGNSVPLEPDIDAKSLAPFLTYAPVSRVDLSPAEIEKLTSKLKSLPSDVIHFGPAQGPIMVRVDIENAGTKSGNWILFTGRGAFKSIKIWRLDGDAPELILDGDDKDALKRNLRTYQAFSSEFALAPNELASFAIIFDSENSTYLPLQILTFRSFFTDRRANIALVSGVVIGALILIILNILFFRVTGQNEFIWLGLAEMCFLINTLHAEGYTNIFLFPGRTDISLIFENVFKCGFAIFMSQFARTFIKTKANLPRIDMFLKAIIIFGSGVIIISLGVSIWPYDLRAPLYYCAWLVAIISAISLPFIGIEATRRIGSQYWPLIIAWGSLATFVIYAAIASTGFIPNLPIYWGLAGPIGLFEALMATFALALHIRRMRSDQITSEAALQKSLKARLEISERAAELHREHAAALASLSDQSSLLYSSGHDMRQVVGAINNAATLLEAQNNAESDQSLPDLLKASATYLEDIAVTSMSAPIAGISGLEVMSLSGFEFETVLKPLERIYRPICQKSSVELKLQSNGRLFIISDRAIIMRALSNLISNAVKFSDSSGCIELKISQKDDYLKLSLTDEGCGVSREFADRLNNFSGERLRENQNFPGSGTGFAAAGRMIRQLGGTLHITPRSQKGTRVSVLLPLCKTSLIPATFNELKKNIEGKSNGHSVADGDIEDVMLSASDPAFQILATYDDSAKCRVRFSNRVSLILLKPLCLEMADHPLVTNVETASYEKIRKTSP